MKTQSESTVVYPEPTEEENRDYAYHLYEQSGCIPGRDLENWLEASACLKTHGPRERELQGPPTSELFGPDTEVKGMPAKSPAKKHVM